MFSFFKKFKREKNANGKYPKQYYVIKSVHSDNVLDIAGDGPYKGKAIIWKPHGKDNQLFNIKQ